MTLQNASYRLEKVISREGKHRVLCFLICLLVLICFALTADTLAKFTNTLQCAYTILHLLLAKMYHTKVCKGAEYWRGVQ